MNTSFKSPPARSVYQVSELVGTLRALIDDALPRVWVEGEVSNFSRPASGHWYFTLKDASSQLRCAMFRNANFGIRPQPRDGDRVLLRGKPDIYSARGELQFICEHLEPAGEGELLRAFEALKKRLAAEGLFAEAVKRPIPPLPHRIGLITSATGAALHDVQSTLARRCPLIPVVLWPVPVQGNDAAPAIARALHALPQRAHIDVILLVRGGGSLEDLWAFNEESVARAIRACPVPVISGVGHEVDFTIADFAADLRAPTPTAAAERATPDAQSWQRALRQHEARLTGALERTLRSARAQWQQQQARLGAQHPQRRLQDAAQRLDDGSQRLSQALPRALIQRQQHLRQLCARLHASAPAHRLVIRQRALQVWQTRLIHAQQRLLDRARSHWQQQRQSLQALDPHAVLLRGYAIARDDQGRALTDAAQVQRGDALRIRLARGEVDARAQ